MTLAATLSGADALGAADRIGFIEGADAAGMPNSGAAYVYSPFDVIFADGFDGTDAIRR